MRSIKRIFFLGLFFSAAIGLARFCHHQTHGFRLSKIQDNFCSDFATALPECTRLEILEQPFHYFNRGLQSFAFLSEDGKYVLKIFNNRYQRRMFLFELLSHIPLCHTWTKSKVLYQREKLLRTFTSYEIAVEEFGSESGLIYAHLNKTSDLPRLTLIDPLQIAHTIDLNAHGFILQHKAEMVYPTLHALIREGHLQEAKDKITSLIDWNLLRCRKGIADNDPLIRTNFGFLGSGAVAIDLGPFSHDPSLSHPANYAPEIRHMMQSLKHWLLLESPELSAFLDQQLDEKLR